MTVPSAAPSTKSVEPVYEEMVGWERNTAGRQPIFRRAIKYAP
jgi:adenylosuccinate synthase